jgi:hypothetical protein
VLRLIFVCPAILYLLGILIYFYSGWPPNCFIGLDQPRAVESLSANFHRHMLNHNYNRMYL